MCFILVDRSNNCITPFFVFPNSTEIIKNISLVSDEVFEIDYYAKKNKKRKSQFTPLSFIIFLSVTRHPHCVNIFIVKVSFVISFLRLKYLPLRSTPSTFWKKYLVNDPDFHPICFLIANHK